MPVGRTKLEEQVVVVMKSAMGAVRRCTLGLEAFVPMTGYAQTAGQQNVGSQSLDDLRGIPRCYGVPVT